jgi:mannose-6-phosphate isomerase
MSARSLPARPVEKIWGRALLPGPFASLPGGGDPVGEIWFEQAGPAEPELLVKYLFTSERLSIQVHPDDASARAAGHARGKDEAWLVLEAAPGAVIGLGPRRPITREALRQATSDGSIESLIDWRPVRKGDFIYSPAGTIHAIGAGLALIEIQQACDFTYRLHDYGRPRELHLDAAIAAAILEPWSPLYAPRDIGTGRRLLATGGRFTVERWKAATPLLLALAASDMVMVTIAGTGSIDHATLRAGAVVEAGEGGLVQPDGELDLLVAYPGPVRLDIVRPEPVPRRRAAASRR